MILPFTFGTNAIREGEIAQLICFVSKGDEPLTITWYLKGDSLSSDPSISTTMIGTRTSMLMINNVGYRHSGTYSCRASNHAGSTTQMAQLRVNGKANFRGREGGKLGSFLKDLKIQLDVYCHNHILHILRKILDIYG